MVRPATSRCTGTLRSTPWRCALSNASFERSIARATESSEPPQAVRRHRATKEPTAAGTIRPAARLTELECMTRSSSGLDKMAGQAHASSSCHPTV